jgi:predicted Fe-Mo cluster-binding NifX family protein
MGWHELRTTASVLIAIPSCQGRVSPVLDTAVRLLVVTRRNGAEVGRREFVLHPLPPEALARSVAELHVDVLLCAALSEPLLRELSRRGVRVRAHVCGEVEAVLRAFCSRRLGRDEFRMPGCWGRDLHSGGCRRKARHLLKTQFKPTATSHSS